MTGAASTSARTIGSIELLSNLAEGGARSSEFSQPFVLLGTPWLAAVFACSRHFFTFGPEWPRQGTSGSSSQSSTVAVSPSLGDGEIRIRDHHPDRKRSDEDEKTIQSGFREDHDVAFSKGASVSPPGRPIFWLFVPHCWATMLVTRLFHPSLTHG